MTDKEERAFADILWPKFDWVKDKEERDWISDVFLTAVEYDLTEETLEFIEENPDATPYEVDRYLDQFIPELIIVDDDEIEEDE